MHNLKHSLAMGLLSPIYLFYGEELLLMEEMVGEINALVSPSGEEWNKEVYQAGEITPADIVNAASSGGFMGLRRLIVVRDITWGKRGKKGEEAAGEDEQSGATDLAPLLSYAADPNPDTVLILLYNGNIPSNSRLLKAVNQGGRCAAFPALKGGEKERWLADYLRLAAKVPERGVVSYLALMSGDGLLPAKNEADKVILYTEGKSKITMADAEDIVSRSSLAGVFDLSDRLAEKKAALAIEILRRLFVQGEAPQKLLAMIGSQYRNTLAVKDLLSRGFSAKEAAAKMAINPYVATKCAAQARHYTNRELSRALEILLNVDISQKRGEGEIKELLEVALLQICAI